MNSLPVTPSDRNLLAWLVLLIGVLLTAAGLLGVWLQGMFYAQGFPAAMTFGEARSAFTWPTAFTTLGSLLIAWALLASSLTATWPPKRRLAVFICFVVFVLVTATICGHLATSRIANLLN
jgi:hypothetical protein